MSVPMRLLRGLPIALLTLGASVPATPGTDAVAAPGASSTLARPADALGSKAEFEAYMEGVVRTQLAAHDIPGAAVAIVDTQGPVLLRGYGYADLAQRRRVDPARTLFRIASITKTFTWAEIMRQVLAGELDLHADVNDYTDLVEGPGGDGRPITLADLMTHSAGFEERAIGLLARDAAGVVDLDTWLATTRPARVRAPGLLPAYSNYGTALAASIAAHSAGRAWETLVEAELLTPLAMTRTFTDQPLPADVAGDLSLGYRRRDGHLEGHGFEYINGAPAGVISSTAADMARWLQAHLNGGRVDGAQALDPALVAAMARPLRRFHGDLPPMLHGFYRMDRGAVVVHGHHGDLNSMQSVMALLPKRGLGIFAVYNGPEGDATDELVDAVIERLAPMQLPEARSPEGHAGKGAARYSGIYAPTRRNHSNMEKAALLAATLAISVNSDGYLVTRAADGSARQWIETAPDRFRARETSERLIFEQTPAGDLRLWSSADPLGAHEQLRGLHAPSLHRVLLVLGASVLLAAVFGYPAASLRRGEHPLPDDASRLPPIAVASAWGTSALGLLVLCLVFMALGDARALAYGVPALARFSLWLAGAFGAAAMLTTFTTMGALLAHGGTLAQRGRLLLVTLAGLLLFAILLHWKLVPWGLP